MNWSKVIKDIQKKKKMTQKDIEAKTGIPQAYISSLLNGRYNNPSWETGNKLLELLK